MIIALIHWRIKPDSKSIEDFLLFWQQQATVADRSGLVGEFLSEVGDKANFPYITWDLAPGDADDFKPYVNVGIWNDGDAFHEQIARYFNDANPLKDFEKYRRTRTILQPTTWRIGKALLPSADHPPNVK